MPFALVDEFGRAAQIEKEIPFEVKLPLQWVECDDTVRLESHFLEGEWTPPDGTPAPSVPSTVTMAQARLALLDAGLYDHVATVIAALPDEQRKAAQVEWDFRPTVERQSALVALLGPALGLDDAALNQLFTKAATL